MLIFTEKDKPIMQADTIMLNHPLGWNYTWDIIRNDLFYYDLITDQKTPAMTLSWAVIGWKWTNEVQRMLAAFHKSYQDYIMQPFKVCSSIIYLVDAQLSAHYIQLFVII